MQEADLITQAKHGYLTGVAKNIQRSDLNARDAEGYTALMQACKKGYWGIVKLLITSGALLTPSNAEGTALLLACKNRYDPIVSLLMESGLEFDVNAPDQEGNTALHAAAQRGALSTVQSLCNKEGIDLDAQNLKGQTPLHLAAREYPQVAKALLDAGASIDAVDKAASSPLDYAAEQGCEETISLFLTKMKNPNQENKEGRTPFGNAVYSGRLPSVKALLKSDFIDPNLISSVTGEAPLHEALYCMDGPDIALAMIACSRVDLFLCTQAGETVVQIARKQPQFSATLLGALRNRGVDVSS